MQGSGLVAGSRRRPEVGEYAARSLRPLAANNSITINQETGENNEGVMRE